jgi:hypothetical protein
VVRLARKLSPGLDSLLRRTGTWVRDRITERRLDEPSFVFQSIAALGAVALAALAWGFWDYGVGLISSLMFINDAPASRLAALQPSQEYRVDTYGRLLDLLGRFLDQDILKGLERWTPTAGTPQGAVISPLLAHFVATGAKPLVAAEGCAAMRAQIMETVSLIV